MTTLLTPGLYRQRTLPARATGPLARGDVAVFLGYAARGPVGVPVRFEGLAQFEAVFGPRLRQGFLWHGAKAFFENGGIVAYALRLADGTAAEATGPVGAWTARASFPWPMVDPRRLRGASGGAAAAWVQLIEAQIREGGPRSPDPGTWGNGLSVQVRRSALATTETIPDAAPDGQTLALASLAGIEPFSLFELTQPAPGGGAPAIVYAQAEWIDAPRRWLRLRPSPAALGLDPARPIRLSTVEFQVDIRLDGRLDQSFDALAPDPRHGRGLGPVLGREARSLHLEPPAQADWTDPATWPAEGDHALAGGRDGLTGVKGVHWLDALPAVARLSEPALIAAPDLVLPDLRPEPEPEPLPEGRDCRDLTVPPEGRLSGRVTTGDQAGAQGSGQPVASALVDVEGAGGRAVTGPDGTFSVAGIGLGLVTVRITAPGYEPLETLVQSSAFVTPPLSFELQPRTDPRALTEPEVLEVAQALGEPAWVGPYKVAILDPPSERARLDDLRTWRSRLGDNARRGLFAPWLQVADGAGSLLALPPSGHVCGAFAAAEREGGIQRGGANRALRYVEGVTLAIDDAEQGLLNPLGINAIRATPGRGIRANGARTLSSDPALRYLTTRRILDAIEKTLESSLAWAAFELNDLRTRHTVTVAVSTFLDRLWRGGTLAGDSPAAAFRVQCDEGNNGEADQAQGKLTVDIGVAPTEPYEFVLFRLGLAQDVPKVTE